MIKKILISILLTTLVLSSFSQEVTQDTIVTKLIVGIKESPPFIIKIGDNYTGLSIDLWRQIAKDLKVIYEYKEYPQSDFSQMLTDIQNSKIDVCINPLTVTSDRLNRFNFTLPFFSSNMAIVVASEEKEQFFSYISNFFSLKIVNLILILFGIIIFIGVTLWLLERRKNKDFSKGIKGIFDGIWWTSVTMTTVGYGDKIPRSFAGRVIALLWMFSSIIIISSITGSIAATLTIKEFQENIETIDDIKILRVGTMKASSSEEFLLKQHFSNINNDFENIEEGLNAVANKEIDAFIYDEAIVKYLIKDLNLNNKIKISSYKMNAIYYSFSVPQESKLLGNINLVLINNLESVGWIGTLNKYDLDE